MKHRDSSPEQERSDGGKQSRRSNDSDRELETSHAQNTPKRQLNRAIGNQGVQELYEQDALQTSLTVSQPDDKHEREAQEVADRVMRMNEPRPAVDPAEEIQRKETSDASEVSSDQERQIRSVKSGGKPLPEQTRNYFEPRFGREFGDVRVHTDQKADEAARSIDAEAFTHGSDIVFRKGNYRPGTREGKQLLAHELTHVVQQDSAMTRSANRVQRAEGEGEGEGESRPMSTEWSAKLTGAFGLAAAQTLGVKIKDEENDIVNRYRFMGAGPDISIPMSGHPGTDWTPFSTHTPVHIDDWKGMASYANFAAQAGKGASYEELNIWMGDSWDSKKLQWDAAWAEGLDLGGGIAWGYLADE